VEELRTALETLIGGRSAMLGEANTMRALSTALSELQVRLEAEKRALSTGEDEAEKLRARKEELASERRSSTKGWQVRMRSEIQRTRVENNHEVQRQMRDVQSWFRQAIDAADKDKLPELPPQVDAALQMVTGRISQGVAYRLNQVAEIVLGELFTPDELAVIRAQFARSGQPIMVRPVERRPPTTEDKLLVFMGVTGGFSAGKLATAPLIGILGGPILWVPTVAIALGAGWWLSRTRKHSADKQHMKQWLGEAIADARSTVDQLLAEQLIEAEQQLSLSLDEALGKRIAGIEEELREVDKALRLDTAERTKRLNAVNKRLADVSAGQDRAEKLLASIRSVRDRA
jgi:hypothetical protein